MIIPTRRQKQSSPSHSSPQDVSSVLLVTLSVASVGVFEVPYPLSSKTDPTYLHPVQHSKKLLFLEPRHWDLSTQRNASKWISTF